MDTLTGGLLGARDAAQPLLTYLDGPARVELSGSTTANWVSKTANLLIDGFGSPDRVGILLPLHWQTVCFVLGGVASGATVVLATDPSDLVGCAVAFVHASQAEAALDVGVEDVLACSGHALGTRLASVPGLALDAAVEIPAYGDHFRRPPGPVRLEVDGRAVLPVASPGLSQVDRVMTVLDPASSDGLLLGVLGPLAAGAALVLVAAGSWEAGSGNLARTATDERVTATAGLDLPGLPRLA